MRRISSRSDTADPYLAKRAPFTTSGALRAVEGPVHETGRLPIEHVTRYRADLADPGVTYVVISWATPIAWVRADGEVVIPDESYSMSTTRHQKVARAWL
jgi:hypothetical protein